MPKKGSKAPSLPKLNVSAALAKLKGLTPALRGTLAERLAVTMHVLGHKGVKVVPLLVEDHLTGTVVSHRVGLVSQEVTRDTVTSHADLQESREWAAYAVALAYTQAFRGVKSASRAPKGGGFDWRVGDPEEALNFLGIRLEVSGIGTPGPAEVPRRLREKREQISVSNGTGAPGWVIVTEFVTPSTVAVLA